MTRLPLKLTSILVHAGLSFCLAAPSAVADDSIQRGAAAIEQWCRLCHLKTSDKSNPDMAPPFEDIVERPGRDRAYFTRFLHEDHFPMTTFRLFENEKADVVAYLMHLKGADTQ